MIQLPYKKKFVEIPDIKTDEILDYLNLEYGLIDTNQQITASDLNFVGLKDINDFEMLIWKIRNKNVCVVVRAYENSYIIEMDKLSEFEF
ncbi:hypothetical protein [Marinicellulosiphila megalodicopiae]|uniref:hypothetical protein n=1 Tax=Marinicellulosiphila megalodicopiae TaxID=2724896 RepID=UPI003BAF8653